MPHNPPRGHKPVVTNALAGAEAGGGQEESSFFGKKEAKKLYSLMAVPNFLGTALLARPILF
jgi:hypothetical protein